MKTSMANCLHCLFDIIRDDSGRWRLAWGTDSPDESDPYACGDRPGHEPGMVRGGRMVPLEDVPAGGML